MNPADVIDLTADQDQNMIVDLTQDPAQVAVPSTPPGPRSLVPIAGMPSNIPLWPLPLVEGQPSYPTQPTSGLMQIEGQPSTFGGSVQQITEAMVLSPTHSVAFRSAISTQMSPATPQRDEDTPEKAALRQANMNLAHQLHNAESAVYETTEQAERVVEANQNQTRHAMLRQRREFEEEADRF